MTKKGIFGSNSTIDSLSSLREIPNLKKKKKKNKNNTVSFILGIALFLVTTFYFSFKLESHTDLEKKILKAVLYANIVLTLVFFQVLPKPKIKGRMNIFFRVVQSLATVYCVNLVFISILVKLSG